MLVARNGKGTTGSQERIESRSNEMRRQSKIVRALLFSAVLVLSMLVEWLRRIHFVNPAMRSLQANLIDIALSRSAQIPIVIILVIYLAVFLGISARNQQGKDAVTSRLFWNHPGLVNGMIGLALLSVVACLKTWSNSEESGSVAKLQLGIDQSTNGLVLLTGLVSACAARWITYGGPTSGGLYQTTAFVTIPSFLAITGFLHPAIPQAYGYRDSVVRWTGLWVNPNIYGILMGVGAVLSFGFLVSSLFAKKFNVSGSWFGVLLPSLTMIVCGIGLFKSYSRGAWLAMAVGTGYLTWRVSGQRSMVSGRNAWIRHNSIRLSTILLSVAVLSFWQFRFTEWRPARRVFSVANINDFSWRNRITAWEGAIRMMRDRPFFGHGWGLAERVYEQKYRPPQLENGMAIQMNDYFMLGISAGGPALVCFLMYVALSLRNPKEWGEGRGSRGEEIGDRQDAYPTLDWTKAVCRAGAIVLLVGFWFDGGLFKLATGSVFWILLELGRAEVQGPRSKVQAPEKIQAPSAKDSKGDLQGEKELILTGGTPVPLLRECAEQALGAPMAGGAAEGIRGQDKTSPAIEHGKRRARSDAPYQRGLAERWLRRVAWGIAVLALVETIVLVGTPFLPLSRATLAIARHWLVPPNAVGDLDFLAGGAHGVTRPTFWNGCMLRVLVQHASLANYNRQLVNWAVDDKIYRECVLWPDVYKESPQSTVHSPQSTNLPGQETGVPMRVGNLNWRRELWEYFYPPVRHENDPMAAAEIVVKFLRERITVDSPKSDVQDQKFTNAPSQETGALMQQIRTGGTPVPLSLTIEEMWKKRRADVRGFEALKAAAFRSVGIPARLNEGGKAEVFADGKWEAAPR